MQLKSKLDKLQALAENINMFVHVFRTNAHYEHGSHWSIGVSKFSGNIVSRLSQCDHQSYRSKNMSGVQINCLIDNLISKINISEGK